MGKAADAEILEWARVTERIVVTLDSDFHAILAVSQASCPSVIRIEGLGAGPIAELIPHILVHFSLELLDGAMITVKERKTTCHRLRSSTLERGLG
jgi:predicted nuclease of predicted toxin-antitoxin system